MDEYDGWVFFFFISSCDSWCKGGGKRKKKRRGVLKNKTPKTLIRRKNSTCPLIAYGKLCVLKGGLQD